MGGFSRRLRLVGILLVLLLPLLGVMSALAAVASQSPLYEGRVDLVLPPLEGAWNAGETTEAFASLIDDPSFQRDLADALEVDKDALKGLKGETRGFGEAVNLRLTHEDRAFVRPTLRAATLLAVQRLYSPQTEELQAQLRALNQQHAQVIGRLESMEARTNGMEPVHRYQNLIDIVNRLRYDLVVDAANGDTERRTEYEQQLAEQEKEMLALQPLAERFERTESQRAELQDSITDLEIELAQAEADYAVVDVERALDDISVQRTGTRQAQLRAAVVGAGAGLFIALAALAVIALVRAREADRVVERTGRTPESRQAEVPVS